MYIVECSECKKKNRINKRNFVTAKCGACGAPLELINKETINNQKQNKRTNRQMSEDEPDTQTKIRKPRFTFFNLFKFTASILIVLALFQVYDKHFADVIEKKLPHYINAPQTSARSYPPNGEIRYLSNLENIAPLTIETSKNYNYLVKLQDIHVPQNIITIFITGGKTVATKIPLGSYELKYTTGTTWYGYDDYFGKYAAFSKADKILHFTRSSEQTHGHIVTLKATYNGNLSTSLINRSSF